MSYTWEELDYRDKKKRKNKNWSILILIGALLIADPQEILYQSRLLKVKSGDLVI